MADLTFNAQDIVPSANAIIIFGGFATENVSRSRIVIYDGSTNSWSLTMADSTNPNFPQPGDTLGMALADASNNQPLPVVVQDFDLTVGNVLTKGETYVLSSTTGAGLGGRIAPSSDLGSDWYRINLGIAKSTTKLVFDPVAAGVNGT